MDRAVEEAEGDLANAHCPARHREAIIHDLTCYEPRSAGGGCSAARRTDTHLLHCGTIWVHGPAWRCPPQKMGPRRAFGDYGIKKAAIETYLLSESRTAALPITLLHPAGTWLGRMGSVNPAGNFNLVSRAAERRAPEAANIGMETLHHVHADDVAQCSKKAMSRSSALGQSFHVVSAAATLRGYAERVATWFGRTAQLGFCHGKSGG